MSKKKTMMGATFDIKVLSGNIVKQGYNRG